MAQTRKLVGTVAVIFTLTWSVLAHAQGTGGPPAGARVQEPSCPSQLPATIQAVTTILVAAQKPVKMKVFA
jgi:hypothetical protein